MYRQLYEQVANDDFGDDDGDCGDGMSINIL